MLLQEMDGVLKGQKEVSMVAEKSQWWEGRKSLDVRVEVRHKDLWQLENDYYEREDVGYTECKFFLCPSENASGDGRGFRGVANSTPAFNLWPWAWSSGEVLPKGTERNKDHTGHSQGMWPLFAPGLVWSSHVPTCSTSSFLLSPWRWFSQHLHSCPCQTCSVL